ncbi:MAG: hypothetical protein Fur0022_10390 [Anaerolineales bacterium]
MMSTFNFFQQEATLNIFVVACLAGGMLLIAMVSLASAIRIIPEYARMAMFRLGRFVGIVGPGIVFLIPLID